MSIKARHAPTRASSLSQTVPLRAGAMTHSRDKTHSRGMSHSRSEWTRPHALWLAAMGAIFMVSAMAVLIDAQGWGYDFEAYYLAALRLARGDSIYQSWTLAEPFRPGPYTLYLYAPPLAVAMLPFTALSLPVGMIVWVGLRIALLAIACRLMPVSSTVRWTTFAAASFSAATVSDLHLGNVSVLVAVLSVLVWRWLDRPTGSVALAVSMSVRPTMGLVLVWMLLRRAWRPVVWTLLAGLLLIGATIPLVGEQGYRDFFRVLGHVSDVTGVPNNLDLGSTVLRLGLPPIIASLALFLGYAVGIGAMLFSLRRDREVGYVVTIGATMLLAPLLWDHYLASLIVPAAFLAERGRSWAVALPLLTWVPPPFLPLVVLAATVLPLLARERQAPLGSRQSRSPGLTPVAASVPAGSSTTPSAPAHGQHQSSPRGQSLTKGDHRAQALRVCWCQKESVDGEPHEQHVDAARGQVQALTVGQRWPAHEAPETDPEGRRQRHPRSDHHAARRIGQAPSFGGQGSEVAVADNRHQSSGIRIQPCFMA